MVYIKKEWKDELYQNIEFLEYELSHGPIINVNTLAGYQFSCNLLDLYNNIMLYIKDNNFNITISIKDEILKSDFNDTCVHMLEKYICNDTYELDIIIIIINNNNYINDNHSYDYRIDKLISFYTKLKEWKNNCMILDLWNNYNLIFKNILYYIDFNDLFLDKQIDVGINSLKTYYNIKYPNYDSDDEIDGEYYRFLID